MSIIAGKQAHASENDEIDLSVMINHLSENRWLILLVTLLVFSLGIFYASREIPQYQSDVLMQIDSGQSNLGQTGGMAQQFMFRSAAGDAISTQIALIKSRYILKPVIQSLGLDIAASAPKGSFWQKLISPSKKTIQVKLFEVPHNQINKSYSLIFDKPGHVSVYNASGHLLLQGVIGTVMASSDRLIRLQVSGINAPVGTRFSLVKLSDTSMVKGLSNQLNITELGNKTRQNTGLLEISLTGTDPNKIILILNNIAKITQVKDAQKKSREAAQILAFLHDQLPLAKGQLEKSEFLLNKYRAQSGKIDIKQQMQFFLNRLSDIDKQLSVLGINKIDLLQRYTIEHPLLIALDIQVKAVTAERNNLEKELKKLPASDQIAVNLMRDMEVKKSLYLMLLSKIQELAVVKAGTVSSVHTLSYASLPDAPLSSKRHMIYLGSIFAGLVLSVLIIAMRKLISPRVNDPHWGEKHFNLANLAIIPYCKEQSLNALSLKEKNLPGIPLLAHSNPRNLAVESLRSLRTSLQMTLTGASNNIVGILGVSPGVGKSFVSVNLAYLLATGGKRVLLIDADLRRGTLHKYMSVPPMPGLTEVIKKTTTVEHAITETVHKNLAFLPRGVYPSDPSEILMSDDFKELITTFAQQYDVVIVDTAPVLLVTDAVLIGAISATNYLIMGAGAHQPGDIEMVLKRLSGSGVQVQGTIFNFYQNETITRSYGQYGKYGKYGYYNTYYDDESIKS